MSEPWFEPAVQLTEASPLPAVALTPVGASGTVDGVTAEEAAEAEESPLALVAVTEKV